MKDIPVEYQIEPQQLLFAGNAYFNFINSLKSPNTKTTYIQCLKQYMQHRKVNTVDELLIGDQRLLQSNIIEYLVSLQQISHGTRYLYAAVLRHFYDINNILLNWKKINAFLGQNNKVVNDRAYTKQEIALIRKSKWTEDDEYFSYISLEALNELQNWMKYIESSGELINDNSWVMRDLWDTRVAQGRGLVTHPKKLTSLGIKRLMERAIWAQGLKKKLEPGKKRHPYQANHSLRKWFKTLFPEYK
jgi:hypothetical protein